MLDGLLSCRCELGRITVQITWAFETQRHITQMVLWTNAEFIALVSCLHRSTPDLAATLVAEFSVVMPIYF